MDTSFLFTNHSNIGNSRRKVLPTNSSFYGKVLVVCNISNVSLLIKVKNNISYNLNYEVQIKPSNENIRRL